MKRLQEFTAHLSPAGSAFGLWGTFMLKGWDGPWQGSGELKVHSGTGQTFNGGEPSVLEVSVWPGVTLEHRDVERDPGKRPNWKWRATCHDLKEEREWGRYGGRNKRKEKRDKERLERWIVVLPVAQPVRWCHLNFEMTPLKLREVKWLS